MWELSVNVVRLRWFGLVGRSLFGSFCVFVCMGGCVFFVVRFCCMVGVCFVGGVVFVCGFVGVNALLDVGAWVCRRFRGACFASTDLGMKIYFGP